MLEAFKKKDTTQKKKISKSESQENLLRLRKMHQYSDEVNKEEMQQKSSSDSSTMPNKWTSGESTLVPNTSEILFTGQSITTELKQVVNKLQEQIEPPLTSNSSALENVPETQQFPDEINKKKKTDSKHQNLIGSESTFVLSILESELDTDKSIEASSSKSKYYSTAHEKYARDKKALIKEYSLVRKYVDDNSIGKFKSKISSFNFKKSIQDKRERLDSRIDAHKKLQKMLGEWNKDIEKRQRIASEKSKSLSGSLSKQDIYKHAGITDEYDSARRDKHIAEMDPDFSDQVSEHRQDTKKFAEEIKTYMKEKLMCDKLGIKIDEKALVLFQMQMDSPFVKDGNYPGTISSIIDKTMRTKKHRESLDSEGTLDSQDLKLLEKLLKEIDSKKLIDLEDTEGKPTSTEAIKKELEAEGVSSEAISQLFKEYNDIKDQEMLIKLLKRVGFNSSDMNALRQKGPKLDELDKQQEE